MARVRYVVRCVTGTLTRDEVRGHLLECLGYAGVVRIHYTGMSEEVVFDIHCPRNIDNDRAWADMNSSRIRSFGWKSKAVLQTEEVKFFEPITDA